MSLSTCLAEPPSRNAEQSKPPPNGREISAGAEGRKQQTQGEFQLLGPRAECDPETSSGDVTAGVDQMICDTGTWTYVERPVEKDTAKVDEVGPRAHERAIKRSSIQAG